MAVKYFCGFESDVAILVGDGIVLSSSPTVTTSERHRTLSGRGGSKSIQCNASADGVRIPGVSVGVGEEVAFAVKHTGVSAWSATFLNSGGTENCSVRMATDGFVRCHRTGTVLATSGSTLAADTWHWIRIRVTAREAASAGRLEVFLNGVALAFADTGAGVDTRATAIDDWASVELTAPNGTVYFDDYVQGTSIPTGIRYIQMLRPTSDASPVNGTPSAGTDRFATIDEDPVSILDYNEIAVAGDEDRLGLGNLGFTPLSVDAVRVLAHMTGEGTIVQGRTLVESGGSTTFGANRALATGGTYQVVGDVYLTDPNGGGAWTGAAVDALIAGYEANT